MSDLLSNLNEAQQQAVTHREGPLMIIAGAGTGKTTVITRRIAWLIEQTLATPSQILALTFTEKAAGEMEERVDQLLPMGYLDLPIHTFHAFCERILREYGMEIGLSRDFDVFTGRDSWLLARRNFDRFQLDHYRPLGNPTRHLRALLDHVATLKEEQCTPRMYFDFIDRLEAEGEPEEELRRLRELARTYETYETLLHEAGGMDFGGLILHTLRLLKERPQILKKLQERYRFILVDEFQDTNPAQYALVKCLAEPEQNLTVVGDDDQSIYRFRGASLANVMQFDEDYPNTHHVVLTENYRSYQEILDASYAFIQNNNPERLEIKTGLSKQLTSGRGQGGVVRHLHHATLEDEAEGIVKTILTEREKDPTVQWKDIGILVRANDHAEPFIEAFERHGIPYQFLAQRGLYTKPVILDVLAWLTLIDDPFDGKSAYRVLTHPTTNVPLADVARILYATRKQGKTLLDVRLSEIQDLSEEALARLEHVRSVHAELSDLARRKRATELLVFTARQTGIVEHLQSLPDAVSKEQFGYLQQLYARIRQFESHTEERSLHAFLEEFAAERASGEQGALEFDVETGPDTVRVLTVHGSKGLEYRIVFVVNLVDRRFPSQHRSDAIPVHEALLKKAGKDEHLEEERRLMYVAMTRARDQLYLTSAEDYGGARKKKPSRFLYELGLDPDGHMTEAGGEASNPFLQPPVSPSATEAPVVFELPKTFSFTQYLAYQTCPLQYKFAHLFHIPIVGNHVMSFGKSVHGAFETYIRTWIDQGEAPSKEALDAWFESGWIDEWYPNDTVREEHMERGRKILRTFFETTQKTHPQPFAVEQPFTLKLGSAILKGQIDRIDVMDDGLHIIDYKTGSSKTWSDLRPEQKDQLYLYQQAAEAMYDRPVRKLTYWYVEDNVQVDFLGTETDLERAKTRMISVIESIGQGAFEPTPGFHCSFCDFRDICPFRET